MTANRKDNTALRWNSALPAIFFSLILSSCLYESREEIDPAITCDTTTVTFQSTIKPILKRNCTICHSGPSPANGLDYEKYTDVRTVANDGRLVGAINHNAGFSPMPKFAPKLVPCDIQKIERWVMEGALNN